MKYRLSFLLLLVLAATGCGRSATPTPVSDFDEQAMDAAIAKARSEIDTFIAELSNPTGESHAVKAPIEDAGETEYFWLIDVKYQNGEFKGTINNEPVSVGNVKLGQSWSIKKNDISDWMFMRDGKMHGNYTLRPLLDSMPEDEAARLRSILAEP